ncbi:MAG: YIP1 family protein [Bacteroidota bacterium]
MDEQTSAVEALPKPSSLFTRISNVFSSPGELFAELALQPIQTSSWMIPLLLSIIMMVGSTVLIFTNDTLRNQALEPQREQMQKMVSEGKLTQEQADRAVEMTTGSKLGTIFAAVSVFGVAVVIFFAIPLVVWLSAQLFLQYKGGYMKIVEMYGLTTFIAFLGGVVTILMMHIFLSIYATPGAWLALMQSYDRHNPVHNVINAINIFTLWQVALVGVGLSKSSGKPTGNGMAVAFGLWAIVVVVIVSVSAIFR